MILYQHASKMYFSRGVKCMTKLPIHFTFNNNIIKYKGNNNSVVQVHVMFDAIIKV